MLAGDSTMEIKGHLRQSMVYGKVTLVAEHCHDCPESLLQNQKEDRNDQSNV